MGRAPVPSRVDDFFPAPVPKQAAPASTVFDFDVSPAAPAASVQPAVRPVDRPAASLQLPRAGIPAAPVAVAGRLNAPAQSGRGRARASSGNAPSSTAHTAFDDYYGTGSAVSSDTVAGAPASSSADIFNLSSATPQASAAIDDWGVSFGSSSSAAAPASTAPKIDPAANRRAVLDSLGDLYALSEPPKQKAAPPAPNPFASGIPAAGATFGAFGTGAGLPYASVPTPSSGMYANALPAYGSAAPQALQAVAAADPFADFASSVSISGVSSSGPQPTNTNARGFFSPPMPLRPTPFDTPQGQLGPTDVTPSKAPAASVVIANPFDSF